MSSPTLIQTLIQVLKTMAQPMTVAEISLLLDISEANVSSQLCVASNRGIVNREKRTIKLDPEKDHYSQKTLYYYWMGKRPEKMPGEKYDPAPKPVKKEMTIIKSEPTTDVFRSAIKKYFSALSISELMQSDLTKEEVNAIYEYLLSEN